MVKTMVLIEKETAKRLKKAAITKHETYDEIINRVFDDAKK